MSACALHVRNTSSCKLFIGGVGGRNTLSHGGSFKRNFKEVYFYWLLAYLREIIRNGNLCAL
jgi:hypothetical protein